MYALPEMDPTIHQIEDNISLVLRSGSSYSTKVYELVVSGIANHNNNGLFLIAQGLFKVPHSVLLSLESTDHVLPTSAEYVAITNVTNNHRIFLNFDGLQSRRLWSYVLLVQICDNITVANTSELSMSYNILIVDDALLI